MQPLPIYILAGGQSSRFGSDKARADYGGKTLLRGIADLLEDVASSITVVAKHADAYEDLGLKTIADIEPDLGPIGGLRTALEDLGGNEDYLLLLACDQLGLEIEWLETLAAERGSCDIALFRDENWFPLPGLYRKSLLPMVDQAIAASNLALRRLADAAGTKALALPKGWDNLRNVNRPEDLC